MGVGVGWGQTPPPFLDSTWTQTPHGLGVCIGMHRVNGTGNSSSRGQPTPRAVKQDKSSAGSVDTTKPRSDPQSLGMCKGERPMGAAKGKQPNTMALSQAPSWTRISQWEKMKFTKGAIDLGYFWYTDFWIFRFQTPPPIDFGHQPTSGVAGD